jgi:hypothetical protein
MLAALSVVDLVSSMPMRYPVPGLLRLASERRKSEADSENDREPDQPHGYLL